MVDHFHEQVMALQDRRPGAGDGRDQRHRAGHPVLPRLPRVPGERKSPYQAIVAFSGEHEYGGAKVTEASLNGFPSNEIAEKIQKTRIAF
jgi:type I restriction enzyme R subunit